MAAKPDAVLIAAVGGPGRAAARRRSSTRGYKGRVYQTHAVATDDFIKLGKEKVEGTVLAAGPCSSSTRSPTRTRPRKSRSNTSRPTKGSSAASPATVRRQHVGRRHAPRTRDSVRAQGGQAGHRAFRVALRDALEQERDVVGTQGVFNMSATNHNGMDERARVLVIVRDGKFRLLAE
jgi:branched-chain amino acid transport system substrate-binding protein